MMQKCLATQIGKNVQVYIDDVVITTKKGDTLIEDLKETFDNLDKFCLKLNPTKCSFGVPAGELLGFLVSARGIEANPEKIQAIVTMRKPTKLKEIQQLTGRVAALSRFVARLGEKALPFYALIKQGEKFQWNEEADRAFEDLKRKISTPPILVAPKEKEPLLLYIAATPQVVSTVLVVEREEEGKLHGVQRPVYFVSEVLSPSKQRKAVRAIFSELDEINVKPPIFPGRLQNTEEESERGQGATTPHGGAGQTLPRRPRVRRPVPPRRLFAYKIPFDLKTPYQLTKLQKDSRAPPPSRNSNSGIEVSVRHLPDGEVPRKPSPSTPSPPPCSVSSSPMDYGF
ncbi:hypothetical protein QYE76_000802 [Lolium multiflorum]|uniref:Reverse transcriptase domain-containing protein n=1 Tax=Lolium multiflorum TaxID=4521 RepID=A0AAD8RLS4_LOLMU|nr:hypothetical protein QYE76_000802 [Lolium multiflorum]